MTADTGVTAPSTDGVPERPFRGSIALEPLGDGRYAADLGSRWTVGGKAHGGLLLVLLARAGLARIDAQAPGSAPDPLAVAAAFLRAPDAGPVELATEVLKLGRTASAVSVRMSQGGRAMLAATLTAGRLPDDEPQWAALPHQPGEPPADATDPGAERSVFGLAGSCDLRLDTATAAFTRREQGPPVLRGWVRPRGEPADVLFALLAGDACRPPCSTSAAASAGRPPCSSPPCCAATRHRGGCGCSRGRPLSVASGSTRTSPWSTAPAG